MSATWIDVIAWVYVYLPFAGCAVLCLAKITDVLVSISAKAERREIDWQLEYFIGEAERLRADRLRIQAEQEMHAPSGSERALRSLPPQDRPILR